MKINANSLTYSINSNEPPRLKKGALRERLDSNNISPIEKIKKGADKTFAARYVKSVDIKV